MPRGNPMSTHCFVDASHGSDMSTRRSQTGILIFCNRAPIIWYSKRQNTVEASTFGSEFQAMKNAVELIEALRYKLRMFGVPIDGPTNVFLRQRGRDQEHDLAGINPEEETPFHRVSSVSGGSGSRDHTSCKGGYGHELE